MRTQATQTEVKKNHPGQTQGNVASTLLQKHGTSPKRAWMVSESVQTNSDQFRPDQTNGIPGKRYHSLSRAHSVRAGYEVQVYHLDAPVNNSSSLSSHNGRSCPSVDKQVNYSSNSVQLDYDNNPGKQAKFR